MKDLRDLTDLTSGGGGTGRRCCCTGAGLGLAASEGAYKGGEGYEAGSYLRITDSCITQLKAQRPSRTCNESKEVERGM